MLHIAMELLTRYALDSETAPEREGIVEHLAECAICRDELAAIRAFESELSDGEVWESVEDFSGTQEKQGILRSFAAQVKEEDAEAERLLGSVLEKPGAVVWADVARKRKYRSGGVVRALSRAAHETCERDPFLRSI